MLEKFLHFVWRFQHYNKFDLKTESGKPVGVIRPGLSNSNQGPDFLEASIAIDGLTWIGNVEIHVKASDWEKHEHDGDPHYGNVVLHVVWENDRPEDAARDSPAPTLALQGRIPRNMLDRYETFMAAEGIPCHSLGLPALSELGWNAWKERLVAERLTRKSESIISWAQGAKNHWEEVFWWSLAQSFGLKENADLFEAMAKSIPLQVLAKHKSNLLQLEALLMGQANLLGNGPATDDYHGMLIKEHAFLKKKHDLPLVTIAPNYLRMRPFNFPTVRLSQLAMLIHRSTHLFSKTKEASGYDAIVEMFKVTANDYWHYRFKFGSEALTPMPKALGKSTIERIIVNTVVPILFAQGYYLKEEPLKEKAITLLLSLSSEKNKATEAWKNFGPKIGTAFDSQAILELTKEYCKKKRCLECALGNKLLKP